ncbi:curlin [Bradyrhizobium ottawaense]|uniref:Curlin n=2 Tax=Bradyrhizobium ottawaense TaxID=931866 RepID=A0A2U8PCR0_9BRAD|nr:curlin [Bradyrhizobium ottawaense]MDA9416226.1 minor curlin subunit [Bradyrhizobium sp. CCBAU 25360]MDA9451615.1 minor curlin subunit [Bradyrhizobium sp. CCBAU 21360]MDA9454655.1 minor curlin subunit [Bradyrhizobium sp. CCBAU 21359]MDA9486509.1 minor curlin subunit [Bradyrhizobium sp. CCBAU 11445]MDA9518320.1 minor curlin subunit [Bradyrhizobium sp. CCBAU 11430]
MRCGQILRHVLAVAAMLAAIGTATQASAGSIQRSVTNRNVSIETVVQFGDNVQPVTIEENSRINIARVIQIGGTGTVDATIIQSGTRNYANVIQVGGTTNAIIGQSGASNTAEITQIGNSTNALLLQIGDMNTGAVRQFGRFNWLAIFQFSR